MNIRINIKRCLDKNNKIEPHIEEGCEYMSADSYFETRLNNVKKKVEKCDNSAPFALVDITAYIASQWKKDEIHREEYFRHLNQIRDISSSYKINCQCVTR